MKRLAAAALLVAAVVSAPGASSAGIGLSVNPLRLELAGGSGTTIVVRNPSKRSMLVRVAPAGFARSLRGRPLVQTAGGAATWLRVGPRNLRIAPGRAARLRVRAKPPRSAKAGDHPALILLTTRPPGRRSVQILLRIGVEVLVRVKGRTVRRLEPQELKVRRHRAERLLELRLFNGGNVTERLDGASLRLVLSRNGRWVSTLRAGPLELLPHSAGIAEFVYRGRVRGAVRGRIELRPPVRGGRRSFAFIL